MIYYLYNLLIIPHTNYLCLIEIVVKQKNVFRFIQDARKNEFPLGEEKSLICKNIPVKKKAINVN